MSNFSEQPCLSETNKTAKSVYISETSSTEATQTRQPGVTTSENKTDWARKQDSQKYQILKKQATKSETNKTAESVIVLETSLCELNKAAKRVDFSETCMSSWARQTRQPKAVLDAENKVLQSETANQVDL